jgi:hypothetical protein
LRFHSHYLAHRINLDYGEGVLMLMLMAIQNYARHFAGRRNLSKLLHEAIRTDRQGSVDDIDIVHRVMDNFPSFSGNKMRL